MSQVELIDIVMRVEMDTGYEFSTQETLDTLEYSERKAMLNGKGQDYIPILFEDELRTLVYAKAINFLGRINRCANCATHRLA